MIQRLKLIVVALAAANALLLSSCSTLQHYAGTTAAKYLEQAFGDAIRSAEGTAFDQIPGIIMDLRAKWLPAGAQWTEFAGKLVQQYVDAHPTNNTEMNKVLEEIAIGLQK